jgi:galactofuranose transport system substrate-binding protein
MKKKTGYVILFISGMLFFSSFTFGVSKQVIVGFSQMEYNNPFRIAETNSIKEEAKKRGYQLLYTNAKGEAAKQIKDVQDLIAQKVNYLVLAPREYEALAPALKIAKMAKVPVILIDREAAGKAGVDYVTLIASDFIQESKRAAIWLAKFTRGKANIIELRGTIGSSVVRDRSAGFREVIADYPAMKIIASQSGDFDRTTGQQVMENMIQVYHGKFNAVFAQNDEMAIGAIQALKAAGITPGKDVILVSMDGEQDALKAIVAGELGASVECSPIFGPKVFDVIENHLKGIRIPTKIVNTDRFFDSSNAQQYIKDAY